MESKAVFFFSVAHRLSLKLIYIPAGCDIGVASAGSFARDLLGHDTQPIWTRLKLKTLEKDPYSSFSLKGSSNKTFKMPDICHICIYIYTYTCITVANGEVTASASM